VSIALGEDLPEWKEAKEEAHTQENHEFRKANGAHFVGTSAAV
jgi:hypothetical protein